MDYAYNFLLLNIDPCSTYDPAMYKIGDRYCRMCRPGYCVHSHCTKSTSIPSCVPCIDSTFHDEPSGKTTCNNCTTCDPGLGLKVKQPCTPSSDIVCGTLEGFYCLDPTKDGCRAAQRHSSCKPGQYINHTGTTSTDTMCSDCPGKTYSDGSLTSCQQHTECEFLEIKPGTPWSDSECGVASLPIVGIIAGVLICFFLMATIAGVCLFMIKRQMVRREIVRTRQNLDPQIPTQASPDQEIPMLSGGTGNDSSPHQSGTPHSVICGPLAG
ncbi:tumor necrosis factor receptor superfamily member 14-like [Salvelinus fontinalis]|uniref:tumor necrosis factor receptor superfamily member 14-like n=1 Tax=Salvelinus fontinalis TaxID=8038 RepID=UPI00248555D5|nr:tumor necrosis factor receptor superfamily member 14-like [Salvelinus fontinalis]